jgi:uncharacterized protein (DUF885 family)
VTPDISTLASDLVDETMAAEPVAATYVGIPGHDDRWSDYSTGGREAVHDLLRSHRHRVLALPETDDPWEALARDVILTSLGDAIDGFEHDEHFLDLNTIASPVQDMREVFDHMDVSDAAGWENIVARLGALPEAVAGYRSLLDDARARGLTVARRQVLEVARQARVHAGDTSAFLALPGRMAGEGVGDDGLTEHLAAGVETARRAFSDIADYLEQEYLADAVAGDAVGEERYIRLARRFLGTDLDPRATYRWGWEEVTRLRSRMQSVAGEIDPGAGLPAVLDLLQTDPGRAASSQAEFRDLMSARLDQALADLDGEHFDVPDPIKVVDVKLAPPGGPLGAYYVPPSEDYARPGSVWFSLGDKQQIPLFDQVSTVYHEGFPGHHLQAGIQQASADRLTRYQKLLVWYPGTGEGWALYAEDVMEELGYLEAPDFVMGKLASEMLRACRVVIDIGSHLELPIPDGQPFHPGEAWTFDTGVEMLMSYAAQDRDTSVSEMNRYLGWPGQAIAYKVGQQAIRDLRAEMSARPGFDLKAFHAQILEIGSTGLDVLRSHVRGR